MQPKENTEICEEEGRGKGADMNKIKELRKAKKITLRELSAATGIAIQTISRYELGQQKLPFERAIKFAAVLGVKVEELV